MQESVCHYRSWAIDWRGETGDRGESYVSGGPMPRSDVFAFALVRTPSWAITVGGDGKTRKSFSTINNIYSISLQQPRDGPIFLKTVVPKRCCVDRLIQVFARSPTYVPQHHPLSMPIRFSVVSEPPK